MARTVAYVLGVITLIAGLWGLLMSPVLGIFDANAMLSLGWLVTGLVLLGVAFWWSGSSAMTLLILGIIYAITAILGLIMSGDVLGIFTNTSADNWLHVVLAVVMLIAGFMGRGKESMAPAM